MIVLVTGAKGFVGKNLCLRLIAEGHEVLQYDVQNDPEDLDRFTKRCDFVFHLAGVNRTQNPEDFMEGNLGFSGRLLQSLKDNNNRAPVLVSSSIQAELDNPYGKSKKAAEELLLEYSKQNNSKILIYRLSNVFGKWCRPNYNSVVATFCHNIARGLDIRIDDPDKVITLCHIDDVCAEFISALSDEGAESGYYDLSPKYQITVGDLAKKIYEFRDSRRNLTPSDMANPFDKKLYATYLTYLPEDAFSYPLVSHADHRGSFTEFLKSRSFGQVSVNIIKPRVVKGNHWHHLKNEKFLVVRGFGVIRFRNITGQGDVITYNVSGERMEVVDIPPGYTHNIENLGEEDMVVVMWANEPFDPQNPDTYFEEV